jgi:hypothetical protein
LVITGVINHPAFAVVWQKNTPDLAMVALEPNETAVVDEVVKLGEAVDTAGFVPDAAKLSNLA